MKQKGLRECLLDNILLQECRQRNLRAFTNLKKRSQKIYILYFPPESTSKLQISLLKLNFHTGGAVFLIESRVGDVDRLYMVATGEKKWCICKDCLRIKSPVRALWPISRVQGDTS